MRGACVLFHYPSLLGDKTCCNTCHFLFEDGGGGGGVHLNELERLKFEMRNF